MINKVATELASLLGIGPMDVFAIVFIIWAIHHVRKYGPQWKTLGFNRKGLVILIVYGAVLFTIAAILFHIFPEKK